jgi:hypothetical protein
LAVSSLSEHASELAADLPPLEENEEYTLGASN